MASASVVFGPSAMMTAFRRSAMPSISATTGLAAVPTVAEADAPVPSPLMVTVVVAAS